jgi:hypothetical protein
MKLSDENIEYVLEVIEIRMNNLVNVGFRGKALREELLLDIKRQLKNDQGGLRQNVCPVCVGSGYKNN